MPTTVIARHGLPRPPISRNGALNAVNPERPFHQAVEASTSTRASIRGPRIATGTSPLPHAVPECETACKSFQIPGVNSVQ